MLTGFFSMLHYEGDRESLRKRGGYPERQLKPVDPLLPQLTRSGVLEH
jgi:hypothetical protein